MNFFVGIAFAVLLLPGVAQAASPCRCHHRTHAVLHHAKSSAQLHHRFHRYAHRAHRVRRDAYATALRYAESYYNYRSPSTLVDYGEPSAGLILNDTSDFNGGVGYGADGFSGGAGYGVWFEGSDAGWPHRDFRRANFHHDRGHMHNGIRRGRWRR